MLELPKGIWRWMADNARDLSRIAKAMEKIAEEIARIRAALDEGRKEDRRP